MPVKARLTAPLLALAALLCLALGAALPAVAADPFNPKPAEGDLVLPLPGGASMTFRPVFIGEGQNLYAQRKFKMGDPYGGYKEYPTSVAIGGSFEGQRRGQKDWLFYMGKYEVTEGQYYAVMGLPQGGSPDLLKSTKPMADLTWFEANQFIDRLNQWMLANAADKVPGYRGYPGFLRLPTEFEWEFAARGGAEVSADDFDRKMPYEGNLAKYEWFSGPKSSHNKVKSIGMLEPNQLMLHDMLGNVCEMTHSLYQIEYYQGRSGGFVARGGHYLTSEKQMRSSMRTEQPFYIGSQSRAASPNKKPTMGLRLVLCSVIFSDRAVAKELEDGWDVYRQGKGATLPAAVSVSPTSTQTKVQGEEAFVHLQRLKKELEGGQVSSQAMQELGLLEASLGDIRFIRKQAEEDSAFAWVKIASERGFFLCRELAKLPKMRAGLKIARDAGRTSIADKYEQRIGEMEQNVSESTGTYSDAFRQLIKLNPEAVQAAMDKYTSFLLEHNVPLQLKAFKLTSQHYQAFAKDQRADKEQWLKDFEGFWPQQ